MSELRSVYDPEWSGIVDAHAHVFPDPIGEVAQRSSELTGVGREELATWKGRFRQASRPITGLIHRAYAGLRHFPPPVRLGVEELGALLPGAGLLIEGSSQDLLESMDRNSIAASVLIAHPPVISNERVLSLAETFPSQIVPAVNFGKLSGLSVNEALAEFRAAIDRTEGKLLLKIHAAADGENAESPRYRSLIDIASEWAIPVILHTGCLQAHLIHRSPEQGHPALYRSWFADWPRLPFILAHMNMHDPAAALELGEEFENLFVDTSWQPTEVIGEAVRRMGSERILFGSDWPLVGDNQTVGLSRISEAEAAGYISQEQADAIRGGNLHRLLLAAHKVTVGRLSELRQEREVLDAP